MNKKDDQKHRIHKRILILVLCVVIVNFPLQPAAADGFGVSTLGRFVPNVELKDSDASLSTNQVGVEFSVGILDLEYTMASFSWNTVSALPFGDGRHSPWQHLHEISAEAKYQAKLNDTWAYLGRITGGAAFEENIDDAYLEARALGGLRYTLWDDRFYLLAGGGMKTDDFATAWTPTGGFEWRIGYGFNLSFIYPVESELTFTSKNDRLSVDVNVMNGHTDVAYAFTPGWTVSFSYDDNGTFHRLSKDSVVEPLQEKIYLETEDRFVHLGLSYAPFKNLICDIGVAYNFTRKMELLDDKEEQIQEYKIDPAMGGIFGISYQF